MESQRYQIVLNKNQISARQSSDVDFNLVYYRGFMMIQSQEEHMKKVEHKDCTGLLFVLFFVDWHYH